MSRTAMLIACGLFLAATARHAVAAQPTTQPNKVLAKLVTATARPDSGAISSESWIAEQTAAAGLPAAVDCSDWTEVTAARKKIVAPRLGALEFQISVRRDKASKLLLVDLAGSETRSIMLVDRLGSRQVLRMDGLPDGRTIFLAMEVVSATAALPEVWGPTTNNLRLSLRVDPETWAEDGQIRFVTVFENTAAAGTQTPMWASHSRIPLQITDAKGKAVEPQTTAAAKATSMWAGTAQLRGFSTHSVTVTGSWEQGVLTIAATSGTTWKWKLQPGKYQVRTVADSMDTPYRRTGTPDASLYYSQRLDIVVAPAAEPQ